jgi:hypothetical protein
MTLTRIRQRSVLLVVAWGTILVTPLSAGPVGLISDSEQITAVSSKVHNGYVRTKLSDGSFGPETYGFAIGGFLNRSSAGLRSPPPTPTFDGSIDSVSFAAIARTIEGPLAEQKYLPTNEPKLADLLIMVFWGRTVGTNSYAGTQFADGGDRDAINVGNARLLGFDAEALFAQGFDDPANMMSNIRKQVYTGTLDAIEDDRY